MKRFLILLILPFVITACDPSKKELKAIGEEYDAFISKELKEIASVVSSNSELDFFPFYFKGADVTYTSSNENVLYSEGTALYAARQPYSDEYCLLKATLTLGEVSVSYSYVLCIPAAEQKLLAAPTVQLYRNQIPVDGFYLDGYVFQNGDQLRLIPPVGASCIFTTDGSNPHKSETVGNEILIDLLETGSLTLKVGAVRDGFLPSPVVAVNGYVLGKEPSLTSNGSQAVVSVSKTEWASLTGAESVFINDSVTPPEEAATYFKTLENEYFSAFYDQYYVLNFLDYAVGGHEWPGKDLKEKVFLPYSAQVEDPGIEENYILFYLINREDADRISASETPFEHVRLSVVDLNGTPSPVVSLPVFLSDDTFSYDKRLLFDSEEYLTARNRGEKSVYVDAQSEGCGLIDSALMETVFPSWGEYMFSPSEVTIVVKFKQNGGDAASGLRAVFGYAAGSETNKYMGTYFNSGFTTAGFEWKGNNGSSAKASFVTSVSGTNNPGIFFIQTANGTQTTAKWGAVNAEWSSFQSATAADCKVTPSNLNYRAGNNVGTFSLGAVNRYAASANAYWRTKGWFHARVYEGILSDDEMKAVVTEMKDTEKYLLVD